MYAMGLHPYYVLEGSPVEKEREIYSKIIVLKPHAAMVRYEYVQQNSTVG